MEEAAAVDRFEEAASLRDQIRTLERLETPQKITTTDIDERDLFGAHVEGERAALQVFSVRDGKVVAREGYLLDQVAEPERLLSAAIQQFYADGRYVPREMLVPAEIPDRELLEAWLSERRGTQVRIRVPQRGEKVRLLELVVRNAQLAFDLEWRHPRKQSQEILRALRDAAGPRGGAAAHRVLRHLEHPGLGHRGLDGGVRGRAAEEVRLPQVPDPRARAGAGRLRVHARGGGAALPPRCWRRARSCPTSSSSTAARASSGRPCPPSRSWGWATSRWPAWPSARS